MLKCEIIQEPGRKEEREKEMVAKRGRGRRRESEGVGGEKEGKDVYKSSGVFVPRCEFFPSSE